MVSPPQGRIPFYAPSRAAAGGEDRHNAVSYKILNIKER